MSAGERVAVTGLGLVTSLGLDAPATMERLWAGERGVRKVSLFDASGQRSGIAAEVTGLEARAVTPPGEREAWSRTDVMAVLAAREAFSQSGLPAGARLSVAVGGTTGGMFEAEEILASVGGQARASPSTRRLLAYPLSTAAARVAGDHERVDDLVTICSACSSGALAVVQGAAWIRQGRADCVLVGGTDGLCRLTFTGFNALMALDPEPCRPFDVHRAGLTLGEGAGFLVLEREGAARERGADVLGWLSGWAVAAEAHHITHPQPSGETPARLIGAALSRAGLEPDDVGYVNAHGTATVLNDAMEVSAIRKALGPEPRAAISSSKAQVGHTLGAAGAIEAAVTVASIRAGLIPPTAGLQSPEVDLDFVAGQARPADVQTALSSSFGFGGTGCVLAFERASARARPATAARARRPVLSAVATFGPLGILEGEANEQYAAEGPEPSPGAGAFDLKLDPARSRRFDRGTRMVTAGAKRVLEAAHAPSHQAGLVAGSAFGNVERSVRFLRRIAERGPRSAPPAEFPHLVPSAPSGNASIALGLQGPVLGVSALEASAESSLHVAASLVEAGVATLLVAGSAEPFDGVVDELLGPLCIDTGPVQRTEGAAWMAVEPMEHARERGHDPVAEIVSFCQLSTERAPFEIDPPRGERAVVLCGWDEPWVQRVVDRTPWRDAVRIAVGPRCGHHEGVGGVALAAGAALLKLARYDEALVCGRSGDRVYLTVLARVPR